MKAIVFASVILLSLGSLCGGVACADNGGPATLNIANTTLVKNGFGQRSKMFLTPVSYTHLTLPTILRV